MRLEHWMQLIYAVIISGTVGFLGTQLFEMKGTLSHVDTKTDLTEKRITRIVNALPEVKARVAWEEVHNNIKGFVLSTKPEKTKTDLWRTYINVYNSKKNQLNVYTISLDEDHKDFPAYVLAGKIRNGGIQDPSFKELELYSATIKLSTNIPESYNTETSFLFRNTNVEKFENYVASIIEEEPLTLKTVKMTNWQEIENNLGKIEKQLEIIKTENSQNM